MLTASDIQEFRRQVKSNRLQCIAHDRRVAWRVDAISSAVTEVQLALSFGEARQAYIDRFAVQPSQEQCGICDAVGQSIDPCPVLSGMPDDGIPFTATDCPRFKRSHLLAAITQKLLQFSRGSHGV